MTNIPNASFTEKIAWLLRQRKRYRVKGNSMCPTLQAGETVLVNIKAYKHQTPQADDIVMALHPNLPEQKIFKRVQFINEYGRIYLIGDNKAASDDSRHFGPVPPENILGQVTSRLR